jgi:N-methylhydantoinase A/oxoprolinase/acetone carboxylase beta subunit
MHLALGIDTGGTYTDVVLVNHDDGSVLAGAKSLTTRHNLAEGVAGALTALFETPAAADFSPRDIGLASISTTLATNALAEGHSSVVTLFLIGYDEGLMKQYGFAGRLSTDDVVYVRGGHNERGEEVTPLDLEGVVREVKRRKGRTEAFAVSGYFSVRNPEHELRVREVIAGLSDCPVSCGHQLSSRLNAVRRATTTALNAHLILPLGELIRSVRHTLFEMGISAPLMVVKGDGSLIRSDIALERPIETILSGPAASVVGAWHLAGRRDAWVVDVGGTTTDIAALSDGAPRLNREGAQVAGWRTMVEAIDVHTTGLGGDSHVRMDGGGELLIGPGRVIPICLLASQFPAVKTELRAQEAMSGRKHLADSAQFLTRSRDAGYALSANEQELAAMLKEGPQPLLNLVRLARTHGHYRFTLDLMEQRGLARRAAFTPTDALHVLGEFRRWDGEAAQLAASLLARRLGIPVGSSASASSPACRAGSPRIAAKALDDSGGCRWSASRLPPPPVARSMVKTTGPGSWMQADLASPGSGHRRAGGSLSPRGGLQAEHGTRDPNVVRGR